MKIKWNEISWGSNYITWFDPIDNPYNRMVGYQSFITPTAKHTFICFWFFSIGWSIQ